MHLTRGDLSKMPLGHGLKNQTADGWRMNQIASNTKASPQAGKALASVVPDGALREILKHLNEETARLRASTADPSRGKAPHHRDLDRAEAEICVDLFKATIMASCRRCPPWKKRGRRTAPTRS